MIKQEVDASDRRAGNEARGRVAAMVGCDPETGNPVLKQLLDQMGLEQKIGGMLTGQALDTALPAWDCRRLPPRSSNSSKQRRHTRSMRGLSRSWRRWVWTNPCARDPAAT
jgi:hypothetical protein